MSMFISSLPNMRTNTGSLHCSLFVTAVNPFCLKTEEQASSSYKTAGEITTLYFQMAVKKAKYSEQNRVRNPSFNWFLIPFDLLLILSENLKVLKHCRYVAWGRKIMIIIRGATIPWASSSGQLNFVRFYLIPLCPRHSFCLASLTWRLIFWGGA